MKKISTSAFIFVFLFCSLSPIYAKEKRESEISDKEFLSSFYSTLFLGERKSINYQGPRDSRTEFNKESGTLKFLDDQYNNHYFDHQTQKEVYDLHDVWFNNVVTTSTCPDITLGENVEYIRYIYRLLTISYLYESLKIQHKASIELGATQSTCPISFNDIFEKCSPLTSDMKKFHERIRSKFSNEVSKMKNQILSKNEINAWILNFQKSTSLTMDPIHERLHEYCHQNKINCRELSIDEIKKSLGIMCDEDRNLIQNLCSEKDDLYGISYVEKASELIQASNAFNLINLHGMGEDCLRRYVKLFSPKEFHYDFLSRQFPLIYSYLSRNKYRYLQGELFLPGALKEFDIKGLSDFLMALKPPPAKSLLKILPRVVKKQVPNVVAPVVVKPKVEIVVLKPEPEVTKVIEPVKIKISEFESAVLALEEKKLQSLSLNMDKFKENFEFSAQMIADLSAPLMKFQTRAALNDMKSYDLLGSASAPVGLIFLKYLIDTENHQGLYNVTTVLGDKFYVSNDIEKKEKPHYIELRNDAATGNRWQIILLKTPK
jgi:hypothetical protein